jgi:hypothetical protein
MAGVCLDRARPRLAAHLRRRRGAGPRRNRSRPTTCTRARRGPQERLEFVARRLAYGDGDIATNWNIGAEFEHLRGHDFKVLLGTPIYLAYVD